MEEVTQLIPGKNRLWLGAPGDEVSIWVRGELIVHKVDSRRDYAVYHFSHLLRSAEGCKKERTEDARRDLYANREATRSTSIQDGDCAPQRCLNQDIKHHQGPERTYLASTSPHLYDIDLQHLTVDRLHDVSIRHRPMRYLADQ